MCNLLAELTGKTHEGRLHSDSSVARNIAVKSGASGKTRHLAIKELYCQQFVSAQRLVTLHTVAGTEDPADAMTKPLTGPALDRCMTALGVLL